MRLILALLLLTACAQGGREQLVEDGAPDGSVISDAGLWTDGGDADAGLSGGEADAGQTDAGQTDAGQTDAGEGDAGQTDAGQADGGGFAFSQPTGNDGGAMTLTVLPESGSSCASLLPQASDPQSTLVQSRSIHGWTGVTSDGAGNLGFSFEDSVASMGFAKDGTVSEQGYGWIIEARERTFLAVRWGGPCLICEATLLSWPGLGQVPLGNGYSFAKNCSHAGLPGGDVLLSCVGPEAQGSPATFERYDENLTFLSSQAGDGLLFFGADSNARILEGTPDLKQWRWVDSGGAPLTGYFPGTGKYAYVRRLIGGGLLESSGQLIASASAAPTPAPQWLRQRSKLSTVLGGRAYALGANDCGLEIRDPSGTLCGRLNFNNCRTPPLPGADGSVALPAAPNGYFAQQTLAVWPALLR